MNYANEFGGTEKRHANELLKILFKILCPRRWGGAKSSDVTRPMSLREKEKEKGRGAEPANTWLSDVTDPYLGEGRTAVQAAAASFAECLPAPSVDSVRRVFFIKPKSFLYSKIQYNNIIVRECVETTLRLFPSFATRRRFGRRWDNEVVGGILCVGASLSGGFHLRPRQWPG